MKSVIKIRELSKFYGRVRGIEDLNLSIPKGEIFGFLGPNGAGKSTTIRLILGLLKPTAGRVTLFGQSAGTPSVFKRIGNVPGELKLYEEQTGLGFLSYMNRLSGKPPGWQEELTEAFGLSRAQLNKKIRHYSHGMKQKLGIIQAMQDDPDLLIMDEPTEGLDPINKNVLYHYLKKFQAAGKTVLFSSHYLAEVEKVCHRVGLVKDGRLITEEAVPDLKKKMFRRMEIKFKGAFIPEDFNLDNVDILEQDGSRLVLNVRNNIDRLLKRITRYEVENLVFPEPSLEDTFMMFYRRDP
ncbi:MAG: ABC transporter ATP-binding protein [Desulfobacterales bacterium]|nr:ABC transporter ATP-binding protein [Desulfobacterales bacterium]